MATTAAPAYTADQALQRLKDGNARFVSGETQFPTLHADILAELARGQQPYATILGCSDSRVPPELLFDAGLGELFVVRVAGNVLGDEISGTLQYAATQLRTPLFVVLGHEDCGAVHGAIAQKFHAASHRSRISLLLTQIEPALEGLDTRMPADLLVSAAVEANVRRTVDQVLRAPDDGRRARKPWWRLVGAVCEIQTGSVRFLE